MMRIARAIAPGFPHYGVQRGNHQDPVFFDREDRRRYLSLLRKYVKKGNAPVWAYCLLSNPVHLLLRPTSETSLYKMMQGLALCYTQHINRKVGRTGRLGESRYRSCIGEPERYLWVAAKYIEQNPVRARIVKKPDSSARAHMTGKKDPVLGEKLFPPEDRGDSVSLLDETLFPALIEDIRYQTRRGTPLGAEDFVGRIEAKLGRSLVRKPRGRPKRRIE